MAETTKGTKERAAAIRVQELEERRAAAKLAAWQRVYAGLSDEDIAEVEKIALDRSQFLRRQPG